MNAAIIVAAGSGTRMGTSGDKLFLDIDGRPLIAHTWQCFEAATGIDEIIMVVRHDRMPEFTALATRYGFHKPHQFVSGGKERQDSVWNGLQALSPATELVAIHDGARPCASAQLVAATLQAASECGAAVAAQKVTDTIKESDDGRFIARHPDRSRLWSVQTPQTFRVEVIRRALAEVCRRGLLVTDDTAACELIGQPVRLVESQEPNPKVTVPADIPLIAAWLRSRRREHA
jgi:2-C-methyl-D-erythritol 4-phosphate cytidylyltransferase